MLEKYFVTLTTREKENEYSHRQLDFKAESFGHAEEQAVSYLENFEIISKIEKEYS